MSASIDNQFNSIDQIITNYNSKTIYQWWINEEGILIERCWCGRVWNWLWTWLGYSQQTIAIEATFKALRAIQRKLPEMNPLRIQEEQEFSNKMTALIKRVHALAVSAQAFDFAAADTSDFLFNNIEEQLHEKKQAAEQEYYLKKNPLQPQEEDAKPQEEDADQQEFDSGAGAFSSGPESLPMLMEEEDASAEETASVDGDSQAISTLNSSEHKPLLTLEQQKRVFETMLTKLFNNEDLAKSLFCLIERNITFFLYDPDTGTFILRLNEIKVLDIQINLISGLQLNLNKVISGHYDESMHKLTLDDKCIFQSQQLVNIPLKVHYLAEISLPSGSDDMIHLGYSDEKTPQQEMSMNTLQTWLSDYLQSSIDQGVLASSSAQINVAPNQPIEEELEVAPNQPIEEELESVLDQQKEVLKTMLGELFGNAEFGDSLLMLIKNDIEFFLYDETSGIVTLKLTANKSFDIQTARVFLVPYQLQLQLNHVITGRYQKNSRKLILDKGCICWSRKVALFPSTVNNLIEISIGIDSSDPTKSMVNLCHRSSYDEGIYRKPMEMTTFQAGFEALRYKALFR